jgi:2',3'-cyclic-nucleotide 2'-phosphodiesterase (5'-nucleotidase family)
MAKLGTQAMVASSRDLNAGAAFLKTEAAKAKLKVLSANLTENDKPVFDGSTVLTVNSVKLGVVGLSAPGPVSGHPELKAGELAPAARAELTKLKGKVDLLVLLVSAHTVDALKLGQELKDVAPDVIVQSGEARGGLAPQLLDSGAWMVGAGQKGQAIGKIDLKLDGKGPFHDLGEQKREQESLSHLESQLSQLDERKSKITDPKVMEQFNKTYADVKARRDEQKQRASVSLAPDARTIDLTWLVLDQTVPDDPALKAEVLKIDPAYSGSH